MRSINPLPPHMFNLEGAFLGFGGTGSQKSKSIILEVEQEHIAIKLPKELRAYAKSSLKVGDRLRCVGRSHVDFKEGIIKLKAYQVFFLPPVETLTLPTGAKTDAEIALQLNSIQPNCSPPKTSTPVQKRPKILVCRKSGCQKRGGRQMIKALERILQTYQLQDQVEIRQTGCQKRCSKAPNLTIMPGKHCYEDISAKDLTALIEEHFCSSHSHPAP